VVFIPIEPFQRGVVFLPRNLEGCPGSFQRTSRTGSRMRLQLHQDPADLMNLKNEWNDLLGGSATNTLFQTWDWNQLWWKHFGTSGGLFLLSVRDAGRNLAGIAPFFRYSTGDNQKHVQFIGGTELSDYLDFIVYQGKESSFYSAVIDFLSAQPELWDVIDLHCIPADSPTLEGLRRSCQQKGFRGNLSVEDVCPRTQLPQSWSEFLLGMRQKDRHEIKRKIGKIQREAEDYGYDATTRACFSEDIESFLELHRKSDATKMAFMNAKREAFFREMAWTFLQAGWLELSFLHANRRKLAGLLNFRYKDTVYVYNSGYDPEFRHWSPGWVLISQSIQDAIEKGMKDYDFMRGSESYKYRFGAKDFEIYRYTIQRREEHAH